MVVQHNLTAMNSNRMLGLTTSAQAKSTEKLSSGYKINRAADDAAGLSISEKMRKQIRGLSQASLNAQDGISAVQTAEGALNEVQDMLQRMNELAVKASNGTMSENDRSYIQNEIDQLVTEIDRVSETTKFNETYLLKGNGNNTTKTLDAHDAGLNGTLTDLGNGLSSFALEKALENGDKVTIAGKDYTIGTSGTTDSTEGYGVYADVKDEKVKIGDSLTYTSAAGVETTYTLVNKMTDTDLAALGTGSKFTIEDENGNKTEYTIAAATDLSTGKYDVKAADLPSLLADHLSNPDHKITVTVLNDGTDSKSADIEVVDNLGTGEVSYTTAYGAAKTYEGKDVDALKTGINNTTDTLTSVTVGGETTAITASKPVSSADISEVVKALKSGDQVRIVDDKGTPTTVTIGEESDPTKGTYSVEDVLNVIKDQYQVEFKVASTNTSAIALLTEKGITNATTLTGTNNVTVIGNAAGSATGNVLSIEEAYEKMAEELQKASSIGADTEASVINNGDGTFKITQGSVEVKDAITLNLHVGADADSTNKISIDISAMSAAGLGVKGLDVTDTTGTSATYAIDAIADAIQQVSTQRSALGAIQNRLEHTINNLDNVVENTTSAESAIRDTDMASEMVKYSNNNILAQAGQSMLAQANQSNQGVLSLLG